MGKADIYESDYLDNSEIFADLDLRSILGNEATGLTQDEFISGMRKSDKFIPIITIVVYYGTGSREQGINALIKEYKLSKECVMEKVSSYW